MNWKFFLFLGIMFSLLTGFENVETRMDYVQMIPAPGLKKENTSTEQNSENTEKLKDIFSPLCQYPELPTGCEITSLTMVLNYYGFDVEKTTLSDFYLKKGEVGTVNFREAFEGDPRDESSFGCYAPVIVDTANAYLQAQGSELRALDLTGDAFELLFFHIDEKTPVIVWGTLDCQEGHYSVTWNVNGEDLTWYTPEHCMVLVGYDEENIWVADPIHGDVRPYDREVFKQRYQELYKQAVVIQ